MENIFSVFLFFLFCPPAALPELLVIYSVSDEQRALLVTEVSTN